MKNYVHAAGSNEYRNDEERLDDHKDAENGKSSEYTLGTEIGEHWDLHINNADVLWETGQDSTHWIGIEEQYSRSRYLRKHNIMYSPRRLTDDLNNDLSSAVRHCYKEYDDARKYSRIHILLLLFKWLISPVCQEVWNEELDQWTE